MSATFSSTSRAAAKSFMAVTLIATKARIAPMTATILSMSVEIPE